MSSKTSGTLRFWRFIALLAVIVVGFGCSGGGGDDPDVIVPIVPPPGGGSPAGPDANPPRFSGLKAVSQNLGNVVLTSDEGSDDKTAKEQLTYLIYASTAFPIDKTTPHLTVTGAQVCATGSCSFAINDLVKDGKTKYYFASNVKDGAGNIDADTHAKETEALSLAPLAPVNTGTNHPQLPTTGVNLSANPQDPLPSTHAVHPSVVTLNGKTYVIWEDCANAANTAAGWAADHPCNTTDASKIFVRRWDGTNWVNVSGDSGLQGNATVAGQSAVHRHAPALAADGNFVYASWEELWTGNEAPTPQAHKAIYVDSFNGTQWTGPTKIAGDGGGPARPALTTVGGQLGVGYEMSPAGVSHAQLFFKRLGQAGNGTLLNKNPAHKAEASAFSRKGDQLFVTWKETDPATGIPNIFVRKLNPNGTDWDLLGPAANPSLNIDSTHEARLPSIDAMDGIPYVAWHECLDATGCGHRHIFVKHFNGAEWIQDKDAGTCPVGPTDCGTLNVKSRAAETPSIAVLGNQVFVSWGERNDDTSPTIYKIQLKSLAGSQWNFHGTRNIDAGRNGYSPQLYADHVGGTGLYQAWVEEGQNGMLQLHVQ